MDFKNPVPVIYQSGYLTIKGYDPVKNFYILGYPNAEVEYGWLNFITPDVKTTDYIYVFEFKLNGSVDKALKQIDDKDTTKN